MVPCRLITILRRVCITTITPYGNAGPGDYPALFTGCFEGRFPKATRLIFGFAILNEDRRTHRDGPEGDGLWAVAVCNRSEGTNPKSKTYKIRRAMLQLEEAENLAYVINLPPAEHFTTLYRDQHRILDIRVACREKDGNRVSLVTEICRPRDGVWECIEGTFEGPRDRGIKNGRPFWLQEDGRAVPYDDAEAARRIQAGQWRVGHEPTEWLMWNHTTLEHLQQWCNDEGTLRILTEEQIAALQGHDSVRYRIAQKRAALGLL